jgi:hypothetical protein
VVRGVTPAEAALGIDGAVHYLENARRFRLALGAEVGDAHEQDERAGGSFETP